MATHTITQNSPVTVAQFVKTYRDAEKRAIVSAGGMAFSEADRLTLNAMRVALNFDYTQAADAVTTIPAEYSRHWQRFQHWAKQIKAGTIRVAPEAAEIADRTHKSARTVKNPVAKKNQHIPQQLEQHERKLLASIAIGGTTTQGEALHQLGMVFATREEALAHLQEVAYGLIRIGMEDIDGLVPTLQASLITARQNLELEAKAQAIVKQLELTGAYGGDAARILELAMSLMPA